MTNEKQEAVKESMRLREQLILSERDKQIVEKRLEEQQQRLDRYEQMNKSLLSSIDGENCVFDKELSQIRIKLQQVTEKLTTAERKIMIQEMMLKTAEKNEWIMKEQAQRMEQALKNEQNRQIGLQEEKGNSILRQQIDSLEKELERKEEEFRRQKDDLERMIREQEFKIDIAGEEDQNNKQMEQLYKQANNQLEQELIAIRVSREKLQSQVEELEEEKEELCKELEISQRKEEANEQMLKQKEMECRRLDQRVQKTGNGLEQIWTEKAEQYQEIARKYDEERRERIKWKTMWEESERLRNKRRGVMEGRANEYEVIVNNCGMMKSKLQMSIKKNNDSEKKIQRLEGVVKELKDENGQVFSQIGTLSAQLACLMYINQMLKENLFNATNGEVNLHTFEVEYVQLYIVQLRKKKDIEGQEKDDLDFFSSVEKLLQKNCTLEAEINKFRQKIKNREIVEREGLDSTEQQLAALTSQLQLKQKEVDDFEKKLASHESIEAIKAAILQENKQNERDIAMEEEQNKIDLDNRKQKPLILKYESLLRENNVLRADLRDVQESKEKLSNNQFWLNQEVVFLQKEVKQQREMMDHNHERIEEKEQQLRELTGRYHEIVQGKMEVDTNLEDALIEKDKLLKRIDFVQDNLKQVNEIVNQVMKEKDQYFQGYLQLQDKNAVIMEMHSGVIKEMRTEFDQKERQLEDKMKSLEVEKTKGVHEMNLLRIKTDNQQVQLQRYEQEVRMVEAIVSDKNQRIEALEKELKRMQGEEELIQEFKLRSGFVRLEEEQQESRQSVIELQDELKMHKQNSEEIVGKYERMLRDVSNKFLELENKYNEDMQRAKEEVEERIKYSLEEKEEIERKLEQALDEIKQWQEGEKHQLQSNKEKAIEEEKKERIISDSNELSNQFSLAQDKYEMKISALQQQMEVLKDDKEQANNGQSLIGKKNLILEQFEQEQQKLHKRQLAEYNDQLQQLKNERDQLIELLMRKKKGWSSFIRSGIGQRMIQEVGDQWSDLEDYCEEQEDEQEEQQQQQDQEQEQEFVPISQIQQDNQQQIYEEEKGEDDEIEIEQNDELNQEDLNLQPNIAQQNIEQQEEEQNVEQFQQSQNEPEESQNIDQQQQIQQEEQQNIDQQQQIQQEEEEQNIKQSQQEQNEGEEFDLEAGEVEQTEEQENIEQQQQNIENEQIIEQQQQQIIDEENMEELNDNKDEIGDEQNSNNEDLIGEEQNFEEEENMQNQQEQQEQMQEKEQIEVEEIIEQDQNFEREQNIELANLQDLQQQESKKKVSKRILSKDVLLMLKQKLKQLELELNSQKSNYFISLNSEQLKQKELKFQIESLENELLARTQNQDIKVKWKEQIIENQKLVEKVRQLEEQIAQWKARFKSLQMEKEKLYLRNISLEEIWSGMKSANEDLSITPENFNQVIQMSKFLQSKQMIEKLEKWKSMFLYYKGIFSQKKVKTQ